jgi:hypothetical protein
MAPQSYFGMTEIKIDRGSIAGAQLFPMPLVPLEQFMLWDDLPAYPKRFRVMSELRGQLDPQLLEKSIALALTRHPLLLARLSTNSQVPHWTIPDQPSIGWIWNHGDWSKSPFAESWDLTQESSLRIWAKQEGDMAYFTIEVHHAGCDGLGARQFVADVILAYDQWYHDPASQPLLKSLKPERLLERGKFARPAPTSDSRSTTRWEKISLAYQFHCRGPSPLVGSHTKTPLVAPHHFLRRQLTVSESKQFEQSCGLRESHRETLNDGALAKLFRVMAAWNVEFGRASAKQRLRIMIPHDLRSVSDGRMPAANRFGFGFVVSDIAMAREPRRLLESVFQQTQAIRKYALSLDFIDIFGALASHPKLARWIIRQPHCMATAVLTNLGDLSRRHRRKLTDQSESIRIGGLELIGVTATPPLRQKTGLGIGICTTPQGLSIGLAADAKFFTLEDAQSLLERFSTFPRMRAESSTK